MNITVKRDFTSNGDHSTQKTIQWTSKNGAKVFIEEMLDSHLHNAIALLERKRSTDMISLRVLQCMKLEKNRREYAYGSEIEQMLKNKKVGISDELKSKDLPTGVFNIH